MARRGELGISVVCTYSFTEDSYKFWDDHNLEDLPDYLLSHDVLVSFNGIGFDIPCLSGYMAQGIPLNGHYDILAEIWNAVEESQRYQKGWGLGPTCERTLGLSKTGKGDACHELVAAGRWAELYSYCLNDVALTKKLFQHIMATGYVISPDGDRFCVRPLGE